ncbi:hypothetical protein, partial [Helicobacter ganmani]|uniref:hypothetical protein n=1 Tax=Helicobacter ganmani TaxID=60246 RepID=UPI003A87201E
SFDEGFSLIIFLIFFARALPEIICNLNLAFYFLFYSFYDFIILFFLKSNIIDCHENFTNFLAMTQ